MAQINLKTKRRLCLCKSISPCLALCRISGLFPVTCRHIRASTSNNPDSDSPAYHGRCSFEAPIFWRIYSLVLIAAVGVQALLGTELVRIMQLMQLRNRPLHAVLSHIVDIIYCLYILLIVGLHVLQTPRLLSTLNDLARIVAEVDLCQSALRKIRVRQYWYMAVVLAVFCAHIISAAIALTDLNVHGMTVVNKVMQNFTIVFYVLFCLTSSVFVDLLGCFEKLTISTLDRTSISTADTFQDTNDLREFLTLVRFTNCDSTHLAPRRVFKLFSHERVEYLRITHEHVCDVIYKMNECFNPQFLVHMLLELILLVVHWYAVVLYFAFDFSAVAVKSYHYFNCFFVIVHTGGMFIFLKNAQHLQNVVHDLTNFLIEYSTRISTIEEHQQIRFFIEKLKFYRPLNASGMFQIDMGIAGPICTNILTYVLVALQFDVPKT